MRSASLGCGLLLVALVNLSIFAGTVALAAYVAKLVIS